jgi:hypothetical protein
VVAMDRGKRRTNKIIIIIIKKRGEKELYQDRGGFQKEVEEITFYQSL